MGSLLKLAGRGLKRAFSKDGGGLAKLTDVTGRRDGVYWIAMVVRVISPVVVTGLAYLFASMAGVPVAEFLETMEQVGK